MNRTIQALWASVALVVGGVAQAHVALLEPAAAAGSSYRASFRVSHGCAGTGTTGIKVLIPDGFQGARPMPKPGWVLTTTRAPLTTPYESHGKQISEDVTEISWTVKDKESALPDGWYDEFVLVGATPHHSTTLWFKVLQSCEKGQNDWSQVPASGSSTQGLPFPAAILEVIGNSAVAHAH